MAYRAITDNPETLFERIANLEKLADDSTPASLLGTHFYAGGLEETKLFLDLGCTFSFTGVITFARNYDEIIKYIPLDRIMSETDCPYVAPIPHRGQRNEPTYVIEVVKMIAKIRGEEGEKVREQLVENVKRTFLPCLTW